MHAICGDHVEPNDVLWLVSCVVNCKGVDDRAIKCVKMVDGVHTVEHLSCICMESPKVQSYVNEFVQVEEIHSTSNDTHKQSEACASCSVASVSILDQNEGRDE